MTATEPILEKIAQAVATVVATITEANGCWYTLSSVTRPLRIGAYTPDHLSAVILQTDPMEDEEAQAESFKAWIQPFVVGVYARPSEKDETPVETMLNRIRGDLEKAFRVDPTLSGLARDLKIGAPMRLEEDDEAFDGIGVVALVHYETFEDDPFSQ